MTKKEQSKMKQLSDRDVKRAETQALTRAKLGIKWILAERSLTQRDLAAALGVSDANVSKMLGDGGNMTFRTIARIFAHLGEEVDLTSPFLAELRVRERVRAQRQRLDWCASTPRQRGNTCLWVINGGRHDMPKVENNGQWLNSGQFVTAAVA